MAATSSFSFSCIASESLFCDRWMRNTIRNVTMVVPVLITSCQVSEIAEQRPGQPPRRGRSRMREDERAGAAGPAGDGGREALQHLADSVPVFCGMSAPPGAQSRWRTREKRDPALSA